MSRQIQRINEADRHIACSCPKEISLAGGMYRLADEEDIRFASRDSPLSEAFILIKFRAEEQETFFVACDGIRFPYPLQFRRGHCLTG